jgi:Cu/Ag efflux protein CusF
MRHRIVAIIILLLVPLGLSQTPFAGDHEHSGHHGAPAAPEVHQGYGTVERVDLATATVRMEHEPIESLRWPKMVMDLKAKDPELLEGLNQGDRIVFDLVKTEKGFLITRIEKIR